MKKYTLLVFFIFLMRFTLHAQEANSDDRWSVRLDGGYGIGLCDYDPCDYYDEDYYPSYDTHKSIGFEPGRGFDINAGATYMFTKNIGVDLGVTDFFGSPIMQKINNYYGENNSSTSRQYKGMIFEVIPSVVFDLNLGKVDPYARFGMIIGAYPLINLKETEIQNGTTFEYTGKYMGNVPLGFSAAAGVKYNLTDHLGIYGEFTCNGINYTPKEYKLTKYTVNGIDEYSTLTNKQKYIDFVKSYDASQTIPDDSHAKQLKQTFPFSNFEINIGASWRF
jgi:hypothetical protein